MQGQRLTKRVSQVHGPRHDNAWTLWRADAVWRNEAPAGDPDTADTGWVVHRIVRGRFPGFSGRERPMRAPTGRSCVRGTRPLLLSALTLLAATALAGPFTVSADAEPVVYTSESTTDATNWHDGRNWRRPDSSPKPPNAGDDAIIGSGRAAIVSTAGATVQSISLSGQLDVDGQT